MPSRFFPFTFETPEQRTAALQLLRPDREMEMAFAAAAANDAPPIDQQLADAFNANNAVMAYVLGITGSTLPVISPLPSPDWYTPFVRTFSSAKVHAMGWQNTITPGLVSIPQGIVDYALLWNLNMGLIAQAVEVLEIDPGNLQAQQTVLRSLQSLLKGVGSKLQAATEFQSEIEAFASNLTSDAAAMQNAINQAVQTQGVNEAQIAALMAEIQALQDQIATWQKVVTGAAIAAGVIFFLGTVIAIFSFGAGLAIGIVGSAASIGLMVAAQGEVRWRSEKIAQDQEKMTEVNQQIASLKVLQSNLQRLITLSGAASAQVNLIVRAWRQMQAELQAVISELQQAKTDVATQRIEALKVDLDQASTEWRALHAFAARIAAIQYDRAAPATVKLPTAAAA